MDLTTLIGFILIAAFGALAIMLRIYPNDLHAAVDAIRKRAARRDKLPASAEPAYPVYPGFLKPEPRQTLIMLARDATPENQAAALWARAIVLLDDGMTITQVAAILAQPNTTIITWYRHYQDTGIEGLNR